MEEPYLNMDLIRLSTESSAVHLNKEFILIDNLDEPTAEAPTDWEFVNHPVKLSFTTAIFCVTGRLRVQVNLQDLELTTNDVLIVQVDSNGSHEPRQLKLELFTYNDRDYIHVTQKGQVEPIK